MLIFFSKNKTSLVEENGQVSQDSQDSQEWQRDKVLGGSDHPRNLQVMQANKNMCLEEKIQINILIFFTLLEWKIMQFKKLAIQKI